MFSRTSRILLVVAALAVGAYFLFERPREREADRSETESTRLSTVDVSTVDKVTLQRGDETLRFERADSLWRMTDPKADLAETSTMASLLDAVQKAQIHRDLGESTDLSPYGLAPPAVRMTLSTRGEDVFDIEIGKRTVDDAWCYALTHDQHVVLVPTDIGRDVTLPVDDYRSRRVLDFQLRDIGAYRLQTPDHSMAWSRRGKGWNTVEAGDSVAGDSVAVEAVLRRLRGLRVAAFVADADTAGTTPAGVITLWHRDATHFATLRFSRRQDAWLAHDGARTVEVADSIEDFFAHTTNELRDRRLLQFSPPDAARIDFASPSVSGSLVRAGGVWSFPNPAMGRVDPDHAAAFVRALRALKWSEPSTVPLTQPALPSRYSISIHGADGTVLDELHAGPRPKPVAMESVTSRSSRGTWRIETARLDELARLFALLKQK